MEKKVIFNIHALYRDDFRITGFSFGQGEKSACIVGSMRGNEDQQLYVCSQLIKQLRILEEKGCVKKGKEILVIPCVNPYSMNIKKRFWSIDNTDINRMFPGYDEGETTQRIADGLFQEIKDYSFGIQFASFYMPGIFVPHVRMMKTGLENVELAKQFGLPYVVLHHPRPFDTATLNYNWQVWETQAFSIYTTTTGHIDKISAADSVKGIIHFLNKQGILECDNEEFCQSQVIESSEVKTIRTKKAGFLESRVLPGEHVQKGQVLGQIMDPYMGDRIDKMTSNCSGTVFFARNEAKIYQNTAVYKVIPDVL